MATERTSELFAREEAFLSVEAWESGLLPIPKTAEFQIDEDIDYGLSEALRIGICSVFDSFDSVVSDDDLIAEAIPYFGRRYRILFRMQCEIQNSGHVTFISPERIDLLRFCLDCSAIDIDHRIRQWRLSRFDSRRESVIKWFSEQSENLLKVRAFLDKAEVYYDCTVCN